MVGINATKQNEKKRMKRNEDSLRDLWDSIKHTSILIIVVAEVGEREEGLEKIFEEITAEKFPNTGKEIINQIQEAQRVPGRINSRRTTSKRRVMKLTEIKDRDKLLKVTRGKGQITYKGTPIRIPADFSTETLQARREWHNIVM